MKDKKDGTKFIILASDIEEAKKKAKEAMGKEVNVTVELVEAVVMPNNLRL